MLDEQLIKLVSFMPRIALKLLISHAVSHSLERTGKRCKWFHFSLTFWIIKFLSFSFSFYKFIMLAGYKNIIIIIIIVLLFCCCVLLTSAGTFQVDICRKFVFFLERLLSKKLKCFSGIKQIKSNVFEPIYVKIKLENSKISSDRSLCQSLDQFLLQFHSAADNFYDHHCKKGTRGEDEGSVGNESC